MNYRIFLLVIGMCSSTLFGSQNFSPRNQYQPKSCCSLSKVLMGVAIFAGIVVPAAIEIKDRTEKAAVQVFNSDGSPCITVKYTENKVCNSQGCVTHKDPYCADLTECDNCE